MSYQRRTPLLVSSEHFKYHGQELPIIYSEGSRLRTILVGKVETLFNKYKNCLIVDPSILSVYRYDFDNLIVYEMLRATCSDGTQELLKTWESESTRIIQEGVLAAWLSFDGYRLNNQIHKQAGELSYGLVLKHPVAIKRAASYLAGFTRQDEMQGLMSANKISRCHNFAVDRAMQRNPDKTKAQIELIVRPYQ